jgi:steroid delta-isomerase-like uncharacterized protein
MAEIGTEAPAALARKLLEAVAAKDLDAMQALQHDDAVDDFVVLGEVRGKQALGVFFLELFTALPDMQFTIERIVGGDDHIAVGEWSLSATFDGGPFQGLEPTGRRVELRGVDVMEFEDGRLRHNTIYYDGLSFARQVGLLPTEGSGADRAVTLGFNTLTKAKKGLRAGLDRVRQRSSGDAA